MFGFLKRFGKKPEQETLPAPPPIPSGPANPPSSATPPATVNEPARSRTVMPRTSSREPEPAQSQPSSAGPAATGTGAAAAIPSSAATVEVVEIPLGPLFAKLHPRVKELARGVPDGDAVLRLPVATVREQLAKGSIRIRLQQLRQFAPTGFFPANPTQDEQEIELPISEIVPRLKPEHLPRRSNQKKVEAPDDIAPIFGANGAPAGQVRIATERSATSSAAPAPAPPPVAAPVAPPPAAIPAAAVPKREPSPVVPPPAPAPAPAASVPIRAPSLDPSLASLKPKAPAAKPTFHLPMVDLASHWAAQGNEQLADLYRHTLEIPMDVLESGLKRGRLVFPWIEFRDWIRLAPGNSLRTLPDSLLVELPLKIIAPRFMESQVANRARKRLEPGDDIPDVFAPAGDKSPAPVQPSSAGTIPMPLRPEPMPGTVPLPKPPAAAAAPSAPAIPTQPTQPTPGPAPVPAPPAGGSVPPPLLTYGHIFGEPQKTAWSLNEVAQRVANLRGVAGGIIATADGLLVAGSWPEGAKPEAVAAFVPQMFSRMQQYSRELKLADSENFTLITEQVPLQIFKCGQTFLAVLGRAGENLPRPQLTAVALRLAQSERPH